MDIEEIYSSDESGTVSEPSRLITEEDYLDMLFTSCDVSKTGKVAVDVLIEYLRFTTSSITEGQADIDELAKLLDPENRNSCIDIESYRRIITPWMLSVKEKTGGGRTSTSEIGCDFGGEETPIASDKRTSTPTKTSTPTLNMCQLGGVSLLGSGDDVLLGDASTVHLQHRVEELQFHNRRLTEQNATLQAQLEATEETTNFINTQMDVLRRSLRSAQHIADKVRLAEAENEELKAALAAGEETQRQLEASLLQAQRDASMQQHKAAALEEQLSQLTTQIEDLEQSKHHVQETLASEKKQTETLKRTVEEKDIQLVQNRIQLQEMKVFLEEMNIINENLKTERSELEVQLSETRQELCETYLMTELGAEESEEAPSYKLPVMGTPIRTPITRTPSIAKEIVSSLGNTPKMPLPLCAMELEKVFLEEASLTVSPEQEKDDITVDETPGELEEKIRVYLTELGTDTAIDLESQQEIMDSLLKTPCVTTVMKSIGTVLERMKDTVDQLKSEIMQKVHLQEKLEETASLLEAQREDLDEQAATIADLQAHRRHLEERVDIMDSANADLIEKYKRTEEQMNDLENDLDKNKQECSKEKKKLRAIEQQGGGTSITCTVSVQDQVAKEIRCLRSQLERSQASLAAIQSKGLPLGREQNDTNANWRQGAAQHSPNNSPLVEALTLDLVEGTGVAAGRRKEGCVSADSILDGGGPGEGDLEGNHNHLEYDQLLASSCPHLLTGRGSTACTSTQTECASETAYVKPRPPAIGATKYAVVNTSTGSSTSGVVDLDVSSGSNRSEPHGVIRKSVLIVETTCSPPETLPSSPEEEDPYDPLCRYRTSSFKRAIERGPSGDSSNQSFETADPASTSPDLTPERPAPPPFPAGGSPHSVGTGSSGFPPSSNAPPGSRAGDHLQLPPYREPTPQSAYSNLHVHHHHHHHPHHHHTQAQQHHTGTQRGAAHDTLNSSSGTDFSTTSSSTHGRADLSHSPETATWSSTSPAQRGRADTDPAEANRKGRSAQPEVAGDIPEVGSTAGTASSTSAAAADAVTAASQDGRQSPQHLRRLSTLVEEGSDAEAEESLLTSRMRSVALPQPGRRAPHLLEVPPGKAPPPDYKAPPPDYKAPPPDYKAPPPDYKAPPPEYKAPPPGYKAPPPYNQATQGKRDTSPRSESRRSPAELHFGDPSSSSTYRPLDRAAPPTVSVSVVSPQALLPNGTPAVPVSPIPSPTGPQTGMPYKRTIFPPPGEKAFPTKFEAYTPLLSPSADVAATTEPPHGGGGTGGGSGGEGGKGGGSGTDAERRRVTARQLAKRNILQEARRNKESLKSTAKDGQVIDLVTGPLEEVELSEADKLLNAQLLEEARKTSAESRHRSRRLRKGSGSDLTRSQTFDDGECGDSEDVFKTPSSTTYQPPTEATPPATTSSTAHSPRSPRTSRENLAVKPPVRPSSLPHKLSGGDALRASVGGGDSSPTAPPRRSRQESPKVSTSSLIPQASKQGDTGSDVTEAAGASANQRPSTLPCSGGEQQNKPFRINVQLSKIREENLLKKRSLTKQSTMPELAERQEQDATTSNVTNHDVGDVMNDTSSTSHSTTSRASPMTAAANATNSAFPSLPDERLKELGLYRQKGDSLDLDDDEKSGEQLSDQELEEKFACLSLAFKTDKLTLERRIDLHERARDIAEQNVNKEIEGLKEAMKTLSPFCTDAQSRDLYSKVQHHVEVLEQSTSRVSSRAEVHGAVQQELRMSKAIEVMVNHVENLKRLYDKEHQELEETKKLLQENKAMGGSDGESLQKRSYSLAGGGLKPGGRRRASVAVLPRKLSTLGVGCSTNSDHPMFAGRSCSTSDLDNEDPKTRFQTLVSDTALKNSVLEGFRRSLSLEQSAIRPADGASSDSTTSRTNSAEVNSSQGQNKIDDKDSKSNLDTKNHADEEAAFQKGYEEGVRAQLGAELAGLREQHRLFYDNLENLVDQNEVSDEEEQRLKTSWVEVVWRLWPGRGALGQRLRFTLAGFVFLLALVSLLFTLIPVGSASERRLRPYSWTAVSMDKVLSNYVQLHHQEAPPF